MEFGRNRRSNRRKIETESSLDSPLSFYTKPPNGNISLKEFDEMAIERLKVLRSVERWNLSSQIKSSEDWMNKLYEDFNDNKYFITMADKVSEAKRDQILQARNVDNISHFILRLAYCKTEDLRRWFIAHETDLFKARFMKAVACGINLQGFFAENNLDFKSISDEEFRKERDNLLSGTYNVLNNEQLESRTFYKVSFTEATELLRIRKVFVKKRFVYVPNTDLVTLVSSAFRSNVSHALAITARAFPQLDDDERIMSLLKSFENRYTGTSDFSSKNSDDRITPQMINKLSEKSFPLCMRNMQEILHSTNHLKHGGRMQYGLFLKAAGLSLEDALQFWRSYFSKVMDVDKFDKQYAYNIRHNYGKEGKRIDYTPYSCIKIIMGGGNAGETHGCPFKHFDENILRQKLEKYKIPPQGTNEIINLVKNKHYQIACQKYFEITHNTTLDNGVNHPNQYFKDSMAIVHGTKPVTASKAHVKTRRSVMANSQNKDDSEYENLMESMSFDDV